jgi:hypothetical protein
VVYRLLMPTHSTVTERGEVATGSFAPADQDVGRDPSLPGPEVARMPYSAHPRRSEDSAMLGQAAAAKSRGIVQIVHWRATVDEDGHYSFAVPL